MANTDVQTLRAIEDPATRAANVITAIDEVQRLLSQLTEVRSEAIYDLYKQVGATNTAKILGISRMNVHRVVRLQEPKDPDPFVRRRVELRQQANAELVRQLAETFRAAGIKNGRDPISEGEA
jgi:hypothetical protein